MIIERFKSIINSKERVFTSLFLIALVSILFVLYTKGIIEGILISGFILLFISWFGKFIFTPNLYLKIYLKKTSIWAGVFLVSNFLLKDNILSQIISPTSVPSDYSSVFIILATLLFIYLINYSSKDCTGIGMHPNNLEDSFSDKDFVNRFNRVTRFLINHLKSIDLETNWSSEHFTPLEAEVEIQHKNRKKRKITDLLSAIKSNKKSKTFLVLGDPGSGKSVALRKLCEDLLNESKETGKISIYINLREWEVKEKWSKENKPTSLELIKFIKKNLKSYGDRFFNKFINDHFDKLLESGRIFIILDSFDEIPALLDENENSWLVDELSKVIYNFLDGTHGSRGILSSRLFRRPTKQFKTDTTLEIRPFSEEKIRKTFINYLGDNLDTNELINHLFKDRAELVPIARNPFNSSLLAIYAEKNSYKLPLNQAELYENYIKQSLNAEETQEELNELNLTTNEIIEVATNIADFMFSSEHGLEVPLKILKDKFSSKIENVANILKFIRLARIGGGHKRIFSFSHRRFNEYFVSQKLLQEPTRIPKESIPTDSRFRDALVMVCEVADEKIAKEIASFCFTEVQKIRNLDMRDSQYLRSIHSLRFLKDAFRARLNLISDFQDELKELIEIQINGKNILSQKLAIEAVGLLKDSDIDDVIIKTLELNNSWLNDTAINACRHLSKISKELEKGIIKHINNINIIEFLKKRKDLKFSASLSDSFKIVKYFILTKIFDTIFVSIGISIFIVIFTDTGITILLAFIFLYLLFNTPYVHRNSYLLNNYQVSINLLVETGIRLLFILLSIVFMSEVNIRYATFLYLHKILNLNYELSVYIYEYFGKVYFTILQFLMYSVMFFIIPWYALFNVIYFIKDVIKTILTDKNFIAFILIISLILFIQITLININTKYSDIMVYMASISLLSFFIISNFIYINDSFYFSKLKTKNNILEKMSRQTISKHFNNLKTPYYRLKYVNLIETNVIELIGEWENGVIPNKNSDEASIRLAKFEERYLGLDR